MPEVSAKTFITMSTVRIESTKFDGSISVGTGFFYGCEKVENRYVSLIITNKHVISNSNEVRLLFTVAKVENDIVVSKRIETLRVFGEQLANLVKVHPDQYVDLCAITIGVFHAHYQSQGESILRAEVNKNTLGDQKFLDSLESGEDVMMVGYPTGLYDVANNRPLVRKGITATNPGTDFNGLKHFAIDCACFPGSSGSPIFLFNEGMYFEGESNLVMGKSRVKLIGVLYAGPQYDVHGEMVTLPIPTETSKIPTLRQMINIGFCVSSTQIEWFEELAKSLLENEKPIPL